MHLKNFPLIRMNNSGYVLSPAYDLVAKLLVNSDDKQELALTINGKKRNLRRKDFVTTFNNANLQMKQQENIFRKMENAKDKWLEFIDISFISNEFKGLYKNLILKRFSALEK